MTERSERRWGAYTVLTEGADFKVKTIEVHPAHRVHNTGPVPLVFVEVQHGDYLGEDDIVRLQDDYGRTPAG